ncbi:carbon-nitrogen hydrolase family protein [Nocardioides sp. W7]|uniref:carbon-nitrogen hydrolase family protein n=1 Tax=Nocardioides sp. W7 TaxID=2931390 RepID=UPI001FD4A65D|nr:carbon-nitrogen hydrolase family protein [Nocardioides sp. W7]
MPQVTIAAVQFSSGNDTDRNLARMLELVDRASDSGADLVVFQEFCNHPVAYDSQDHVWQSAISEDGWWVQRLGAKAADRGVFISFNATTRGPWPSVHDQNYLLSDSGEVILTSHKQILMGDEKTHFSPGRKLEGVVETRIGRIGLMSCMEGLIPETPRVLGVRGADIILNSLSSNGLDEAHTHIPVRAAENEVFVVSANRSGPLVDPVDVERVAREIGFDPDTLLGGGESQVVDRDGESLVRAKAHVDDMVVTTVDLSVLRPDGYLSQRRPELYGVLVEPTELVEKRWQDRPQARPAVVAATGLTATAAGEDVVEVALAWCRSTEADLMVLPELFSCRPADLRPGTLNEAVASAARVVDQLQDVARERGCHVVAGLPRRVTGGFANSAVLVGPDAEPIWYDQVHVHPDDADWAVPGAEFVVADLPFGRVGLMLGQDMAFPESARLLTLMGADVVICPTTWRRPWEARLAAPERAAENHVTVVAAARADSPVAKPSTVLTFPAQYRFPETGEVNMPDRYDGEDLGGAVVVRIETSTSRDKLLMQMTSLVADRQPDLYTALTEPV